MVPSTSGLLALIAESALLDEIDRVAAAAAVRAVHLDPLAVPARKVWAAAGAVVLDSAAAQLCAAAGLPRRPALYVGSLGEPDVTALQAALAIGAHDVLVLPDQADELVRRLSEIGDGARETQGGATAAVLGGRGGAGASLFSAALAYQLEEPLLMDLDPWSGGIDLLVGAEQVAGLRWPELTVQGGRLNWAVVRAALPHPPRHRRAVRGEVGS